MITNNRYTATVSTEYRDTFTSSPRVCLNNVMNLDTGEVFRDGHTWIPLTSEIKGMVRNNQEFARITFVATVREYQTRGPVKESLINISGLVKIGNSVRKPKKPKAKK